MILLYSFPIFSRERVGWYNWGLVAGRTQTYLDWKSQAGDPPPAIWQHDIYHEDGTPYDPEEIERRFRGKIDVVIAEDCPGEPSSIIDLTGTDPIVVREGRGDLSWLS